MINQLEKNQSIKMKNLKNYFLFALLLSFLTGNGFNFLLAQGKQPPAPVSILYSNSDGSTNNPLLTTVKPQDNPKNPQLVQLEAQLESARTSGNTASAQQIQAQIDNMLGNVIVHQPCGINDVQYGSGNTETENDYNLTQIHPWSIYSHAFGVAPAGSNVAGRLFYVLGQDSQSGQDSLKIMYSTNNGASWSTLVWLNVLTFSFNRDEMDIEIVNDGTTTWIFGVVGITDNSDSRKKVFFFRQKADGSGFYWTLLDFPGSGAGMNYYNPRITSDNSNYTSNAYVMVLCSMDSTYSGNHTTKQKYMLSSTPFAVTPGLNYSQPSGSSGFYWYTSLGTNANAYLYSDIAYYRDDAGSGSNRLMTVYNCYSSGFNNIYIAYTNGYSSYGGNVVITEPNINKDLRIAFNGGASNRNGLITYVRQYSATDWDLFGFRTTNGGSLSGDWVRDTIDYTTSRTRTNDIIAVRGGSSQFRLCYGEYNSTLTSGFYRSFNGSTWSAKFQMTNSNIDTNWAEPKAGYINGGGDDGLGIWSNYGGYSGFCARNMASTTGIINSQVPAEFSLSQNYPNPFNPSTKIKFALPSSVNVSLKIFDITGKQVAELVNGSLPAGTHEYTFDAAGLSSGVYFYKLESNGFTQIKKMMLVK